MANIYWPFDIDTVSEWPGGYSDIRYGVHMGTDFAVAQGSELRATTDGTITQVYTSNQHGWGIDITNDDGIVIRNWHLSRIDVSRGQWVSAGQVIGLTGGAAGTPGAGNSTGPHLHWELRTNSNFSQNGWLDPRNMTILTFGQNPTPTPSTNKKDKEKMMLCHKIQADGSLVFLLFSENFYLDFTGQEAANAFAGQIGSSSAPVSQSFFDKVKAEVNAGRK